MILPKMDNPHLVIVNPAAGMMAYNTANHQFAVFNGMSGLLGNLR
ncbi:hypothetical protein [Chryseobacterium daecheongense]|nr:hypothetical protein [Chryseobacterium daecheongense]